jgi:hypothetical protein
MLSGSSSLKASGSIDVQSQSGGTFTLASGDSQSDRSGAITVQSQLSNFESGSLTFISGNTINVRTGKNTNSLSEDRASGISFASGIGLTGTGTVAMKTSGALGGADTGAIDVSGISTKISIGMSSTASGNIFVSGGNGKYLGGDLSISALGTASTVLLSGGNSRLGIGGAITVASRDSHSSGVVSIRTSTSSEFAVGMLGLKAGNGLRFGGNVVVRGGGSSVSGVGGDVSFKTQPIRGGHTGHISIKSASGGDISLQTSSNSGSGKSLTGSISLISGSSFSVKSSEIDIQAGDGVVQGGSVAFRSIETISTPGGPVLMSSGDSQVHGGHVRMETSPSISSSGAVQLKSGDARNGASGSISLEVGHASGNGANILVAGHANIVAKAGSSQASSGGKVDI